MWGQAPKQVRANSEQHLASQAIDGLAGPRPSATPEGSPLEALLHAHVPLPSPHPPQVISQQEGDFFFDSLRQVSDWVKKNKPQKEGKGSRVGARKEGCGWDGGGREWGDSLPPWARVRRFPWHLLHSPCPFLYSFSLISPGSCVWLDLGPGGQGQGMGPGLEQMAGLQGDEGYVGARPPQRGPGTSLGRVASTLLLKDEEKLGVREEEGMRFSSRRGSRSKHSSDGGVGGIKAHVLQAGSEEGGSNALATRRGGEHRSKCLLGRRTVLVLTGPPGQGPP